MKKYVICGVSNRALEMFIKPLLNEFSKENEIVGLLDSDPLRFTICDGNFWWIFHSQIHPSL